jgi:hypothetical protein
MLRSGSSCNRPTLPREPWRGDAVVANCTLFVIHSHFLPKHSASWQCHNWLRSPALQR